MRSFLTTKQLSTRMYFHFSYSKNPALDTKISTVKSSVTTAERTSVVCTKSGAKQKKKRKEKKTIIKLELKKLKLVMLWMSAFMLLWRCSLNLHCAVMKYAVTTYGPMVRTIIT